MLAAVDYDHWVAERDRARAEGRHVGIGVVASNERSVFSSTEFWFWFDKPEFTPTSSPESASLQIDPTGNIVVTLHSQSLWGNSPETVVSQVVAEEFDVDPASITVTYADSQHALPGTGPGGSRYTVMVSGAVAGAAAELKDKIKRLVAHKLEVSEARSRVPRRRGGRARRARPPAHARRDRAQRVHVPARPAGRHGERPGLAVDLRPSAHDAAERRPLRPRHLLSVRRPRLAHRGDRGRSRDRASSSSCATRPCTTPARS